MKSSPHFLILLFITASALVALPIEGFSGEGEANNFSISRLRTGVDTREANEHDREETTTSGNIIDGTDRATTLSAAVESDNTSQETTTPRLLIGKLDEFIATYTEIEGADRLLELSPAERSAIIACHAELELQSALATAEYGQADSKAEAAIAAWKETELVFQQGLTTASEESKEAWSKDLSMIGQLITKSEALQTRIAAEPAEAAVITTALTGGARISVQEPLAALVDSQDDEKAIRINSSQESLFQKQPKKTSVTSSNPWSFIGMFKTVMLATLLRYNFAEKVNNTAIPIAFETHNGLLREQEKMMRPNSKNFVSLADREKYCSLLADQHYENPKLANKKAELAGCPNFELEASLQTLPKKINVLIGFVDLSVVPKTEINPHKMDPRDSTPIKEDVNWKQALEAFKALEQAHDIKISSIDRSDFNEASFPLQKERKLAVNELRKATQDKEDILNEIIPQLDHYLIERSAGLSFANEKIRRGLDFSKKMLSEEEMVSLAHGISNYRKALEQSDDCLNERLAFLKHNELYYPRRLLKDQLAVIRSSIAQEKEYIKKWLAYLEGISYNKIPNSKKRNTNSFGPPQAY